MLAYCSTIYV